MPEPTASQMIRSWLDEDRPDRYDVDDRSWMQSVVERVALEIPAAEARQRAARQQVEAVETAALRNVGRFLREIVGEQMSFPLDEFHALRRAPIAVDRIQRVALAAMRATDWRTYGNKNKDEAQRDYDARMDAVAAALWLADEQDRRQAPTTAALAGMWENEQGSGDDVSADF